MPNYIEFISHHNEATYGSPVHDGRTPKRYRELSGVRVDGEQVEFLDESIPDRLYRYMFESRKLLRRRIANDCVAFVALMNSVELKGSKHNPFRDYGASVPINATYLTPLVLTQEFRHGVKIPLHIIQPAHLLAQVNYLHKLGDEGPLCMSDLQTSMRIMNCDNAHPVSV